MERQIKEEENPARQENAKVVLKFVRQHGYPAQGYRFLGHHGIMEVWTDDDYPDNNEENLELIGGSFKDTYGLYKSKASTNAAARYSPITYPFSSKGAAYFLPWSGCEQPSQVQLVQEQLVPHILADLNLGFGLKNEIGGDLEVGSDTVRKER
ncbi:hypothetical protein N8I77_008703 [Diaporthe amygdali]|uniref:Uncharacterized protein n=1 Tax=Phomopsis amygdali TaxID=1214568 RepID=A0AAD9S8N5_PHOAM|nr:hypothetical protein N8I77_008703 [Diaporthe amygdali]